MIDFELEIIDHTRDSLAAEKQNLDFITRQILSGSKLLLSENKAYLSVLSEKIKASAKSCVLKNDQILNGVIYNLKFLAGNFLINKNNSIDKLKDSIIRSVKNTIENENIRLKSVQNSIHLINPENVINRGYSLTYFNNKLVKNTGDVRIGDTITTRLKDGRVKSNVTEKKAG